MARAEAEVRSGDGGPPGAASDASVTCFRRKPRHGPSASPEVKEAVSPRSIRHRSPRPDRNAVFGLHQQVEAFHGERWRKGVVSKLPAGCGNGMYSVCFPAEREEFLFSAAEMRRELKRDWAHVAEDQEEADVMFCMGTQVEVNRDEGNYGAAWFIGTVLKVIGERNFLVEYGNLKVDDGSSAGGLLKEIIDIQYIRPCPPSSESLNINVLDELEGFHQNCWFAGVVLQILPGSRYIVKYKNQDKGITLDRTSLRPRHDWIDGHWTRISQENHGELQVQRETNGAVHKHDNCFNLPISGTVIEMGRAPVGCTSRPQEVNVYNDNEFAPGCVLSEKAFLELEDRSPINPSNRFSLSRESAVHDHNELNLSGSLEASVKTVMEAPIDPIRTGSSFSRDDIPDHDELIPSRLSAEKATLDQGGRAEIDPAPSRPFTGMSHDQAISVYVLKEPDEDNKRTKPFMKMSTMWQLIESMDVFHTMPQQPHFKPLEHYGEEFREGMAIGLMVTFANLVAWTKNLQITDSQDNFEDKFTCLECLESHGFNVQLLRSHLEKLLEMRSTFSQYKSKKLSLKERIIEGEYERDRLDALIVAQDKLIMELKKHLHIYEERRTSMFNSKNNKDLEIVQLKKDLQATDEAYLFAVENFNSGTDAQW